MQLPAHKVRDSKAKKDHKIPFWKDNPNNILEHAGSIEKREEVWFLRGWWAPQDSNL